MSDTNTDKTMIYAFLSLTIGASMLIACVAVYFGLQCQRNRGEISPESLQESLREVVVISPAVGLQAPLVQAARDAQRGLELAQPAQMV